MSDSLWPHGLYVAYQGSSSMEFSRQEYWSGFPFPSPGDLFDPRVKLMSPTLQADVLPSEPPGKPSKGNQPWILIGRIDAEAPIHWPPDGRADSLEKTLMLGKIEGRRRRGQQRIRWLGGIIDLMDMSLSKFWEIVKDREAWHVAIHGEIDTT